MFWCSTSNIILDTCGVHLSDSEDIFDATTGEDITVKHFLKRHDVDVVKLYGYFDFQHRAMKFDKM